MASYNAYSRVLLTKEIVDCIDQVLDNGNVASNLEKELREVKTNWENHDNSDTTNIPFDLLRTLHNKTRECSPGICAFIFFIRCSGIIWFDINVLANHDR